MTKKTQTRNPTGRQREIAMNANSHFPADSSHPKNLGTRSEEMLAIARPLAEEQVTGFGVILDEDLKRLEERFASFVTHRSYQRNLGR